MNNKKKEKEEEKLVFDLGYRNNSYFLFELAEKLQTVVPFLGAGASKAYGFPLWANFINEVIAVIENGQISSDAKEEIKQAKELLAKKNFLEAIDALEQTVGRLNTYVEHVILRKLDNEAKKARYRYMTEENDTGLWGSYLNRFPSRKYLTLNYDTVIKEVLRANFKLANEDGKTRILTPSDFIHNFSSGQKRPENEYVIYHLHGVYFNPDTLIFSSTNYDDFYGKITEKYKLTRGFPKELDKLNRDYNFLFIGCNLNSTQDKIYKMLFSIIGNTSTEQCHYAFLNRNEVGNDDELNKKEDELIKSNIRVLWYSANTDNEYQQAIKELCSKLFPVIEKEKAEEVRPELFEEKKPIEIPLKYQSGDNYKFYIVFKDGVFYLTDKGATYEKLDKVFELKEPDVQKNLSAIAKEYKEDGLEVAKYGNEEKQRWIMVKLKSNNYGDEEFEREVEEAKHKLIACVSFMDTMRIFYR